MVVHVSETRVTATPRAVMLARLADAARWPEWSPFTRAEIEKPGPSGPGSPGEIRWFFTAISKSREEVLPSDGDVVLRYRLLAGLPLKNYVAEVRITEDGDTRRVTWSSAFDPQVPLTGWFYGWVLGQFFVQLVDSLVAA